MFHVLLQSLRCVLSVRAGISSLTSPLTGVQQRIRDEVMSVDGGGVTDACLIAHGSLEQKLGSWAAGCAATPLPMCDLSKKLKSLSVRPLICDHLVKN